jgi:hypothetical protein
MLIQTKKPERISYLVGLSVHVRRNRDGTLKHLILQDESIYEPLLIKDSCISLLVSPRGLKDPTTVMI